MLLTTKTTVPHAKADTLYRERLLTLLRNNLDKMLVLIIADAGYGKTTLLAQAVKEARLPCVFYDLDKNDSDLMVFYSYLVYAIKQIDPALVKYSTKLLKSATADGAVGKNVELLFGTLINELYEKRKEELFVILDNYHNIAEDSMVHRAMDFFIDRLPETVHVIISSRSVPPLPSMARWRAKMDMFEISRDDLAFTGKEIAALLKDVYKTVLPEEDLRIVAARTEGWITGIRLIMQSAQKDNKTIVESLPRITVRGILYQMEAESAGGLFEYFAAEILSGETPEMQEFLIKCSILEILTHSVCDAVLAIGNSEHLLNRMEKQCLFVSAIGAGEYRYHLLFREFLQGQLKDRGERESLHEKAALYYEKRGVSEQAIHHLLEAGRFDLAAKGIVKISREMFARGRITKLSDWLGKMPGDMIDGKGELLLIKALICRERGCLGEAYDLYFKAETAIKNMAGRGRMNEEQNAILSSALHGQARILQRHMDYDGAIETLNKALRFCPSSNQDMKGGIYNSLSLDWQALGDFKKAKAYMNKARAIALKLADPFTLMSVEFNIALQHQQMGEIKTVVSLYKSLYDRITKRYYYGASAFFVNAAASAIALGEHDWADTCLETGRRLSAGYNDLSAAAKFDNCAGSLSTCREQWEKAFQCLDKARQGCAALGILEGEIAALRNLARLFRCQGNYEKADEYLSQALKKNAGARGGIYLALLAEKAHIDSSCGRLAEAEKGIQSGVDLARKKGAQLEVFQLDLAMAAVRLKQNKERPAQRIMVKAIKASKLKGYDGILMRELRACPKLIRLTKKLKVEPEYLSRILSECKEQGAAPEGTSLRVQLLGVFELSDGSVGRKIILKRKTTKAILAFFLLHPNKDFTWEEIAAWAWPESSAGAANHMYRNALCEIHHNASALKKAIEYKVNCYTFKPEPMVRVDALEFHDAIIKAKAAAGDDEKIKLLEHAIALYHGPCCPGLYYLWADDPRNAYEEEYTRALAFLAQTYFEKKENDKNAECCLTYLKTDELEEEIHRLLMANYVEMGHKFKAVKHFANLKKILRKQLQVEPSAETVALMRTLL